MTLLQPPNPSEEVSKRAAAQKLALTSIYSIRCIYNKDGEITMIPRKHDDADDRRRRTTHDRNVCVLGSIQCRSTNSVIVTDRHVRQRLKNCPPRSAYIKDSVQRLRKRADILLTNEAGESNTTKGRVCFVEMCT